MEQAVHERRAAGAGARVDDKARRFLDHGKVLVFENDPKRDRNRLERRPLERGEVDFDLLAAPDTVPGFFAAAFDKDRS
jgi:hypothetical protein